MFSSVHSQLTLTREIIFGGPDKLELGDRMWPMRASVGHHCSKCFGPSVHQARPTIQQLHRFFSSLFFQSTTFLS